MRLYDASEESCFDLPLAEEVVDAGEIGEFDVELGEVELVSVGLGGEHSHLHVLEVVEHGQSGIILCVDLEFLILEAVIVRLDIFNYLAPSIGVIGLMKDAFDDVSLILFGHIIEHSIAGSRFEIRQFEILGDDIG